VGLTAAALLAGVAVSGDPPASGPTTLVAAKPATAAEPAAARSVTLVTGDRVELQPSGLPAVVAAPGRQSVPFRISTSGGHVRVVPIDAAGLIAQGRLDPRLFDVTALAESGYDDVQRPDLPLIVQYAKGQKTTLPARGGTVIRRLPSMNADVVAQAKKDLPAFWNAVTRSGPGGARTIAAGFGKLWLNGKRHTTLDQSTGQIGAPAAWQAGWTGAQVDVAVIDSGIDSTHPDLAGKVVATANFTTEPGGDLLGHGTHVASIIGGSGAASDGRYRGVAPGVRLLDAKVCTSDDGCPDDAILAGMEWAAAQHRASVVNMSLGQWDTPGVDLVEQAVNDLSARYGTLFVIAAGNSGPSAGSIDSPASADAALAVGAVDRQDQIAGFSSRGPRSGDGGLKPDVTAPGVQIVAARAAGTLLGDPVGEEYVALSGTSMATPHVSGAAAILRQQHPLWTGDQLKAALMGSALPSAGASAFDQGAGRVDLARAISQRVTVSPPSLGYGVVLWPHGDDEPLIKTVTYHNSASAEISLDLQVQAAGPDGPAPAALFTVSPAHVVVPAGGTAQVTVTADTRADGVPIGRYTGRLLATGGETAVVTPLAVEKESERYEVSLRHIGRDGQAPQFHISFLDRVGDCGDDPACGGYTFGSAATSGLRLSPGRYALGDFSFTAGRDDQILLMQPVLDLHGDVSVTLDARHAEPVVMAAPHKSARMMNLSVRVAQDMHRPEATLGYSMSGDASQPLYTGALGAATPDPTDLVAIAQSRFAEPGVSGDFVDSPYEYNLAGYTSGNLFTGMTLRPAQRDFATVETSYAATTTEIRQLKTSHGAVPATGPQDLSFPPDDSAMLLSSRLPVTRTEYFLAAGLTWSSMMVQGSLATGCADFFLGTDARRSYQAGQTYHQGWSHGVFGPAFGRPRWFANGFARGVMRQGDRFAVGIMNFVDGDPGHVHEPKMMPGSVRLLRDGEVVTDGGARLPAGAAAPTGVRLPARGHCRAGVLPPVDEDQQRVDVPFRSCRRCGSGRAAADVRAVRTEPRRSQPGPRHRQVRHPGRGAAAARIGRGGRDRADRGGLLRRWRHVALRRCGGGGNGMDRDGGQPSRPVRVVACGGEGRRRRPGRADDHPRVPGQAGSSRLTGRLSRERRHLGRRRYPRLHAAAGSAAGRFPPTAIRFCADFFTRRKHTVTCRKPPDAHE
jgi:subtilisin family serine protease